MDGSDDMIKLYSQRILALAAAIPHAGRLAPPAASARRRSPLCGSTVTVDLRLKDGRIVDFAQEVRACALGQASASVLARNVVGATTAEIREAREAVRAMLKENGPPPGGDWADLAVLEPVRDFKARHASTMLTFDAVVHALDQIETGAKA